VCASFRGPEIKVRRADIVITINTNTTPSSEDELPIIWFTDYSVQHSLLNRTLKPQAGNQVSPSLLSHGNYSLSTLKTQYFKFKHVHHHYLDDTHPFSLSLFLFDLSLPRRSRLSGAPLCHDDDHLDTTLLIFAIKFKWVKAIPTQNFIITGTQPFLFFRDLSTIHLPPTKEPMSFGIILTSPGVSETQWRKRFEPKE
jgi:hypothetical protein